MKLIHPIEFSLNGFSMMVNERDDVWMNVNAFERQYGCELMQVVQPDPVRKPSEFVGIFLESKIPALLRP